MTASSSAFLRQPRRGRASSTDAGFGIVELLVVILIVALLAAIAIPVFLRQRQRGYAVQVASALRGAANAAEAAGVERGDYSDLHDNVALLGEQGFKNTDGVSIGITADDASFCVAAVHERLGADDEWQVGSYSSAGGVAVAGPSTCPAAAVLASASIPDLALGGSGDPEGTVTTVPPATTTTTLVPATTTTTLVSSGAGSASPTTTTEVGSGTGSTGNGNGGSGNGSGGSNAGGNGKGKGK